MFIAAPSEVKEIAWNTYPRCLIVQKQAKQLQYLPNETQLAQNNRAAVVRQQQVRRKKCDKEQGGAGGSHLPPRCRDPTNFCMSAKAVRIISGSTVGNRSRMRMRVQESYPASKFCGCVVPQANRFTSAKNLWPHCRQQCIQTLP